MILKIVGINSINAANLYCPSTNLLKFSLTSCHKIFNTNHQNKKNMSEFPKFEVVVKMPDDVPNQIVKANTIKAGVNTSTYYPTPVPTITVYTNHIKGATDAEAGTKTTPPTVTIADRDTAVNTMLADVESYRLACQALVDEATDEANALAIAQSFAMDIKASTSRGVRQDDIKQGTEAGTVIYYMKGEGPHMLQISFDAGVTHTDLTPTGTGKTTLTGLDPNKNFWLRNRQILTKGRYSEWTDWKKSSIRDLG